MITGLNHLTLAVTDLEKSCEFYVSILGMTLKAKWNRGAYLMAGDMWLCLSKDKASPATDYTHYAFSIDETQLHNFRKQLELHGIQQWKDNSSEGNSLYVLDPDGHQLELHVGDLQTRLTAIQEHPYDGLQIF